MGKFTATESYRVRCGNTQVSVSKRGSRQARTATILGRQLNADGTQTVWLDRLVVPPGDITLNDDWRAQGAISTVLTGPG